MHKIGMWEVFINFSCHKILKCWGLGKHSIISDWTIANKRKVSVNKTIQK